MNIYNNFLEKEDFKNLEAALMSDFFPWYFNNGIKNIGDKYFQFTFTFILNGKPWCNEDGLRILEPILKKLKYKKMNRVKANLTTRTPNIQEHGMHTDDVQANGTTGIFYLNTCDGYTKFKNGANVKSEKNKYDEFDSNLKHDGTSCTNKKRKVVINFNYE